MYESTNPRLGSLDYSGLAIIAIGWRLLQETDSLSFLAKQELNRIAEETFSKMFSVGLAFPGSGAPRGFADKEDFLKNYSLRQSDFPVDSPIAAEARSAAFEIELSLADSVSQFEASERHGSGGE